VLKHSDSGVFAYNIQTITIRKLFLSIFIIVMLGGCVGLDSVPKSSANVNFEPDLEGRTGWSKYEEVLFFRGVDKRTAYLAAKEGLAEAGFTIKRASYKDGAIIGEHGITKYDWNIVAGVYIKEKSMGTIVKAIVQGSKDVGFWGDMTAESWPQIIFKGMKDYILSESLIGNPAKRHFK